MSNSQSNNEQRITNNEDEISLKELILKIKEWISYLWSKKWTIIIAGIIGGALGLAYSFIKKPIYTATTTFVLESGEKGGGLGAYAGLAAMAGIDLGGGGGGIFQGDNILELYKSRSMVEKALLDTVDIGGKKTSLIDHYVEVNKLREKWNQKPETKDVVFNAEPNRIKDSLMTDIIYVINKNILSVAKPDKKLSIIKVDVKSENEQFSKLFNEKIVQTVNDFYVETKTKKSLDNIAILQHQTDSVKAVMYGAIYQSAAVADATPNLNPTRQVLRTPAVRSQANAEANKAIYSELVKNLEMAKITARKEAPLIQVIDEPVYPLEKDRLGKIKTFLLGGIIFVFLSVLILLSKKVYKGILN
ncbi:lipopolysaccharide biosynthesis protein [Pseudopedobacter saltans DSM 12145]|uniref:Lipopolysaccharide biosynthesis protein n=1 Tax=Pseudopedobacter saltans (strain ATCC 51119 / DSM 12145 / JCM 21818 / CCUG 39354 / LMG 10337 / NBRC 100064 / NCIMB 13643) TaxID=762903 RepID=F0SBD8_PSESL|nr:Wzz/FepE/Etk N-terminal domain-containing protein [Pseudopedobacter saltans]ADY53765.1 lipopolysaccharide biosynthesis protein [Pseudopedobacter saltans DSM 12145]